MPSNLPAILIVDDEQRSLETIRRLLSDYFEVHIATNTGDATKILKREWIQVIVCDQRMPDMNGFEFLSLVREKWPNIIRIIISGYSDPDDIINAINQAGIYQFIRKPWQADELLLKLQNAVELFKLYQDNEQLAHELKLKPTTIVGDMAKKRRILQEKYNCDYGIVRTATSSMNQVCETIKQVAPFDINILLTGESGTGKELCSRALHYNSLRKDKTFVAENYGALPDQFLESELFGHKRGAFTGATEDRIGLFELADGGTILLDEIEDLSAAFQVKLLRVLQDGEVRPLGSNRRRIVNVRVIATTNINLEEEVKAGRFREDLYYRLSTFAIPLPPLREHKEDISSLAIYLLEAAMKQLDKQVTGFTDEALNCLQDYDWPGNVRELQSEIKRMLVLGKDKQRLGANLISAKVLHATPEKEETDMNLLTGIKGPLKERIKSLEARILKETMIRHRWNKTRAAEELGLSRVGLRNKLERYNLDKIK